MARRAGLILLGALLAASQGTNRAEAAGDDDARPYQERAATAFALSRYAQAGEYFEKAYEETPDPALLYNAAQSHRLAGNKERALSLYQNYLRMYGKKERRAEIETRIDELKRAIENDKSVATSPPTGTDPVAGGAAGAPGGARPDGSGAARPVALAPAPAPAPRSDPGPAATLVASPAPPAAEARPITRRPLFWAVVGGGVAAAVTVVLLLALSGERDPSPTIGRGVGN